MTSNARKGLPLLDLTCIVDIGDPLPDYDAKVLVHLLNFHNPRKIRVPRIKRDPFAELPNSQFIIAPITLHWWVVDTVRVNARAAVPIQPTKMELACLWAQICVRWWRRKYPARQDLIDNPYMIDERRTGLKEAIDQLRDPELYLHGGGSSRFEPYLGVHGSYLEEVEADVQRLEKEEIEKAKIAANLAAFDAEFEVALGPIPANRKRGRVAEEEDEEEEVGPASSALVIQLPHRPKKASRIQPSDVVKEEEEVVAE